MDYLSNNVQIVKSALNKKGLDFEVIEFSENTGTSLEAAKVIGCDVAQITKSIIFRIVETNEPLLVLASGVNRIDEKKLEMN
ncbi:MAG UNVERIFIED_CONTAM: hypothetical protein LVQ98_06325 [Rickettsiaceae bacterium]|jgi:prolyl-tRNA editing enzyme YbaK/EbsC (Cys-tRNA(Pro) deacylase)